jgi:hypothetical protein
LVSNTSAPPADKVLTVTISEAKPDAAPWIVAVTQTLVPKVLPAKPANSTVAPELVVI